MGENHFWKCFNAFRAYTRAWCCWKTYPILRGLIGLICVKIIFERGFNAFWAYTRAWCYWKTYPILRGRIGLIYERKSFLENVGNFAGPMPHGLTWGLVLLKDLPKPPIPCGIFMPKSQKGKRGWVNNIYNVVNNGIMTINKFKAWREAINVFKAIVEFKAKGVFMGPMPYGITWWLMPRWGLT